MVVRAFVLLALISALGILTSGLLYRGPSEVSARDMREFRKLRVGMSVDDVTELYGQPKVILSGLCGNSTWGYPKEDSNIAVFFDSGRVSGARLTCDGRQKCELSHLWIFSIFHP